MLAQAKANFALLNQHDNHYEYSRIYEVVLRLTLQQGSMESTKI